MIPFSLIAKSGIALLAMAGATNIARTIICDINDIVEKVLSPDDFDDFGDEDIMDKFEDDKVSGLDDSLDANKERLKILMTSLNSAIDPDTTGLILMEIGLILKEFTGPENVEFLKSIGITSSAIISPRCECPVCEISPLDNLDPLECEEAPQPPPVVDFKAPEPEPEPAPAFEPKIAYGSSHEIPPENETPSNMDVLSRFRSIGIPLPDLVAEHPDLATGLPEIKGEDAEVSEEVRPGLFVYNGELPEYLKGSVVIFKKRT